MGNGGGAGKVAAARSHGLALVVAVEGVGGVCLDSVGQVAEAIGLYWGAIRASSTCIVQGCLQCLGARVTPGHTPGRSFHGHKYISISEDIHQDGYHGGDQK